MLCEYISWRLTSLLPFATTGITTVIAGSPTVDGVGSAANFLGLDAICVDLLGNVFVSDTYFDGAVRRVTSSGGDWAAVDLGIRSLIMIFRCDVVAIAGAVSLLAGSIITTGAIDGLATNARFATPQSLAVDAMGNLFIGERSNYAIRRVGTNGSFIL